MHRSAINIIVFGACFFMVRHLQCSVPGLLTEDARETLSPQKSIIEKAKKGPRCKRTMTSDYETSSRLEKLDGPCSLEDIGKILGGGAHNEAAEIESLFEKKMTMLHLAALFSKPVLILKILRMGVNVDVLDADQETPLHKAVQAGSLECVGILLDHGASPNCGNATAVTPLIEAISLKNTEIAKYLLNNGADKYSQGYFEFPCVLEMAINMNLQEIAMLLIEKGARPLAHSEQSFFFALAIKYQFVAIATWLIDQGYDVNAKFGDRSTVLNEAIHHRCTAIAIKLIEAGAILNIPMYGLYNPLDLAIMGSMADVVKLLLDKGAESQMRSTFGYSHLHIAAHFNAFNLIEMLTDKASTVNALDNRGQTPLHVALSHESHTVALELLERGSPVSAQDSWGNTPLHHLMLSTKASLQVFDQLMERDADPLIKNKKGQTPLQAYDKLPKNDSFDPLPEKSLVALKLIIVESQIDS